jgi:hypothetical protein
MKLRKYWQISGARPTIASAATPTMSATGLVHRTKLRARPDLVVRRGAICRLGQLIAPFPSCRHLIFIKRPGAPAHPRACIFKQIALY